MSELSMMDIHRAEMPVRIGISSCLLGERVRYDGGHKRDDYLVDVVGRYRGVDPGLSGSGSGHGYAAGDRAVDPGRRRVDPSGC